MKDEVKAKLALASDGGKTLQLTQESPGLAMRMKWQAPDRISAFVIPSSQSPESSGKWITLAIPKT